MAQDWARSFYASKSWEQCRDSFISTRESIDGGICQDCRDALGVIAHHWPVALTAANINDPFVALNPDNLRWVCKACHDKYPGHGVAKRTPLLVTFDSDGDVLPPPYWGPFPASK